MANRYWVGGSGTWSSTNTANWSATSGGAGGASVPTAADSVFFNQAGTYTVTISGTVNCLDFNITAGTVTISAGSVTINVFGSFSIISGTVWSSSWTTTIVFAATTTGNIITTNGVTITSSIDFNGTGAWTLGSALTSNASASSPFNFTKGTFNTGNYNITAVYMTEASGTKTLNFGSSTITLTNNNAFGSTSWTTTNVTINPGTSTFNITAAVPNLYVSGLTFYNMTISGAIPVLRGPATFNGTVTFSNTTTSNTITGANTFNNLTIVGNTSIGVKSTTINANQTITGTLTIAAGTGPAYRNAFTSSTTTVQTITCAAVSLTDVDFEDITIAGAAAPATGTRLGNCAGNSGITFPAAKTVYWNLTSGPYIYSNAWALTSSGTPAAENFPLAQDTMVFPASATNLASGSTVTIGANFNLGSIDMSARTTNTMTLALGSSLVTVYGDITCSTGSSIGAAANLNFAKQGTQTITPNGSTWAAGINVGIAATSLVISGAFASTRAVATAINLTAGSITATGTSISLTGASGGITVSGGTLSAGSISLTQGNITHTGGIISATTVAINGTGNGVSTTGATSRTLNVNGTWTIAGSSAWTASGSGLTIGGSGKISLAGTSSQTFAGGGFNYSSVTVEIATGNTLATVTFTGSNTFGTLSNTVQPRTIYFTAGTTTTVTNWNINGTAGNLVTVTSPTAATHTLSKSSGSVSASYLDLSYSVATGGASWTAGPTSVDSGNNTGWIFNLSSQSAFLPFFL